MKPSTSILVFALTFLVSASSGQTAPDIEWQKNLGGTLADIITSMQQTTDQGYIAGGYSYSNDGDVSGNHGWEDFWAVKLDVSGNIQWQNSLGGGGNDGANSIRQTADGGYVMAGYSNSKDGDVSGKHGSFDFWVVKLDPEGNLMWQKCLGGANYDAANVIRQTPDGGYIVAGQTYSNTYDVSGNHGGPDCWVVKLDTAGGIEWQKCLGGTLWDVGRDIHLTAGGGYIVTGETYSNDGDVSGNHGGQDGWMVKLDKAGTVLWQLCLGGTHSDGANSIYQTTDGGFVIAGSTFSNDGDVSGNHGVMDAWVVKLDAAGFIEWQKCLGGTISEYANSAEQTSDGCYIIAGGTDSQDGDVSGNHGAIDLWIFKLDTVGNLLWQKCLGGSDSEYDASIQQTEDGGYAIIGYTGSIDGDISNPHGDTDGWLVKLFPDVTFNSISTGNISPLNFLQNDAVSVPYTASGTFNSGNIFTAQLSDASGNFSSPTPIGTLASTTSGTINAIIPSTSSGTGYRIRVVSSDPVVTGSDNGENITIGCFTPTATSTTNITSASAKLNWSAVEGAIKYKIRYKVSGNNPWATVYSSSTSKKINGLTVNTNYTWQVKSICSLVPSIESEWSAKQNFTTSLRLGEEEATCDLQIYPNPFSSYATIQFKLDEPSQITIKLFSVDGIEMMTVTNGEFWAGRHQISLSSELNSGGIYFLQMNTGSGIFTEKIVIE